MSEQADMPEQIRTLRDLARQARRLAAGVSDEDRGRLLKHAEELEQQAQELEQRVLAGVVAPPPPVVQVQVQQQQQRETSPPADPHETGSKD